MKTLHQQKQELNRQLDNGEITPVFTDTMKIVVDRPDFYNEYNRYVQIITWNDTHVFFNTVIGEERLGDPAGVQATKILTLKDGTQYTGLYYGGSKNPMNLLETYETYEEAVDGELVEVEVEVEEVVEIVEEAVEAVEEKSEETQAILDRYVPKKLHEAIKDIQKGYDGYDVLLNDGWLLDQNNTIFISPTIKDLKQDLKYVEKFEYDEWVKLMVSMGYKDVERWSA